MASRLTCVALVLASSAAGAHDADVILVAPRADQDQLVLEVTLTAQTLAQLAPVDANEDGLFTQEDADQREQAIRLGFWAQVPVGGPAGFCALVTSRTHVRESDVQLEGRFRCPPGELTGEFKVLSVLPKNFQVVLAPQAGLGKLTVRAPQTTLVVRAGPERRAEVPPPPAWVWAIFLAVPITLFLFERRRF